MNTAKIILILLVLALSGISLYADTVVNLKSGKTAEGILVERTDDYVKIDFEGVTLKYWTDQIQSIVTDGVTVFSRQPPSDTRPESGLPVEESYTREEFYEGGKTGVSGEESFLPAQDSKVNRVERSFSSPQEKPFIQDSGHEAEGAFSPKVAGHYPEVKPYRPPLYSGALAVLPLFLVLVIYVFFAFCLQLIGKKTGTDRSWLAWVPVANYYYMCKIAERPSWWAILLFVPIVSFIIFAIVGMGIAEARGKPPWTGLLLIVPVVNIFLFAWLAFSE